MPATGTAIFTICARNYYPLARTLAQSVRRFHPDATFVLCVVDEPGSPADTADFDEVFPASILPIADFNHLAFRYTLMELSTAIKPMVFERLFDAGYRDVIYLDPDIVLYARMDEVLQRLDQGATTVLTPHGLVPNEQQEQPNDQTFLLNGAYNLGFMALRDGPDVRRLLAWWGRRLATLCVANRLDAGLFVDQKWIDLWPAYCPDVHVLRHPGYNVAYWNLDTRTLAQSDGGWTVDGQPLVFFHFSGIVPGEPRVLSKHQGRWFAASSAALGALTADYHAALDRNRNRDGMDTDYVYGRFHDGTPIPMAARWLFRDTLEPFAGDPFARLLPVLVEPAREVSPNPNGIVTRLSYHLWQAREDLRRAFSLSTSASQLQYSRWFVEIGWRQADIPPAAVEPVRDRLAGLSDTDAGQAAGWRGLRSRVVRTAARRLGRFVFASASHLRPLYRFVKPEHRRRLVFAMFVRFGWPEGQPDGEIVTAAGNDPAPSLEPGLALIGYPFAEMGVGEALRALARSAEAAAIPFDVYNFDVHVRARQNDRSIAPHVTNRLTRAINVLCVNADMAGETTRILGSPAFGHRFNVIRPFWELAMVPPEWRADLQPFDEIWAPTAFVRDAFAALVDRPVVHIPVAVDTVAPAAVDRRALGLPEDRFLFLCMFDMASYPARKNPEAAIRAFHAAFGGAGGRDDVGLVIKTMGAGPEAHRARAQLAALVGRDPRVVIIDRTLERADVTAMMTACDAYVSLHRSEGFGLGLAEALSLGKSVVATDYSGSTDFLTADTGFPVAYRLIPVLKPDYPYFIDGQVWADPDIDDAARQMRRVVDGRDDARKVARAGQAFIRQRHSPAAVGRNIRERLQSLGLT